MSPKEEQFVLQQIEEWNGATTTKVGMALRKKTYSCFNGLVQDLGKELSKAINTTSTPEIQRLQLIKTILAKYNIYTKNEK